MCKAARPLDGVDSSNPCRWRGKRLHHHGGGVCWLFVLLWMDLWHHELIVCKKWYKINLKMRLTALLFDPPRRAPHLWRVWYDHCKGTPYTMVVPDSTSDIGLVIVKVGGWIVFLDDPFSIRRVSRTPFATHVTLYFNYYCTLQGKKLSILHYHY